MSERGSDPGFPIGRAAALVTVTGAALAAMALAIVTGVGGEAVDQRGALAAVALVWAVALADLALVRRLAPFGPAAVAYAHYGGAAVRLAVCLLGGVVIAETGGAPAAVVLTTVAAAHVPMVILESALVGRFVRRQEAGSTARRKEAAR